MIFRGICQTREATINSILKKADLNFFQEIRYTHDIFYSGKVFELVNVAVILEQKAGVPNSVIRSLGKLRSPERIQDFVSRMKWNYAEGATARSVVNALAHGKAQCIEGALVAACALWLAGRPPLLMDMGAEGDADHVVALFRRGRYWGAISKSNSPYLRYRDPIYRSLREVSISYFPQYVIHRRKTLRNYSTAIDLTNVDPALWVTRKGFCSELIEVLDNARHYDILPSDMPSQDLRPIDPIVKQAARLREHPRG